MDLSSQEEDGEMPIPINSTYGHHPHMIHHDPHPAAVTLVVPPHHHGHHHHHNNNHIIIPPTSSSPQILPPPSSSGPIILPSPPSPLDHQEDHINGPGPARPNYHSNKKMVVVRYRECLKNHAASMGGNATDGCGEFMPSGEDGTIEALTCSACNCHRNFHRKETEHNLHHQHSSPCDCSSGPLHLNRVGLGGRKLILGHHHHQNHHNHHHQQQQQHRAIMGPGQAHYPMIMSYNMGSVPSDQSDEQDDDGPGGLNGGLNRPSSQQQMMVRKRFRTKFSQEQKEKMFDFAERVGWKIQKQEESVVQQLCQEIGVKRRVLKVWMHNNKHNLAKKNMNINSSTSPPPPPNTQGQL